MASNTTLNIAFPTNDMEPCLYNMDPPCLVHSFPLLTYFIAKLLRPNAKIRFLPAHGYSMSTYGNTTSVMDMIYQGTADMTPWYMTINKRRHDGFSHLGPLIRSSFVLLYRKEPLKSPNLLELGNTLPWKIYLTALAFIFLLLFGKFILSKGRFNYDVNFFVEIHIDPHLVMSGA